MDKVFIRNFVFFVLILLSCVSALTYSLMSGDRELDRSDNLLLHTHEVITEAHELSTHIKGMLSAQRGYLLTGDQAFLNEYETKKAEVSDHIASLSELTADDASQQSRLDEIRSYFTDFSKSLEQSASTIKAEVDSVTLQDVEVIDQLKTNIIRLNSSILDEEYALLNERFQRLDHKKSEYFNTLIVGIAVGTVLLLALNFFLLSAQRKRNRAEASLKDTEERFALAIEGTEDGIFDWDIENDTVFYSKRFFEMLGYTEVPVNGSIEQFKALLHPSEAKAVSEHIKQYLSGNLSEYRQEYRMKHKSGRWVWMQSRAKALFDKNGIAYRMVGAHTDITHTVKEHKKLENEKEQAEAANQAKSDFLAHMSHEIRTPLTAISGIAEIFDKTKDELGTRHTKLVSTLISSTHSLKDLINDILDFSKIESGELELEETQFVLGEVFESVVSMMSLKASEKGISFVFDYHALKDTNITGDAKRMRQILINLVNNAVKFTDEGGVTVKAHTEDRDGVTLLRVDVSDTGIGISPENFDLVFERFKQADSSVSRKYGGTGLGLPISRNLAKLMGGDILISSAVGTGSTFSLLIPLRATEDTSENTEVAHQKLNDQIRKSLSGTDKILIVEDYQGNVVVMSYILEELGAAYDVAETGVEALEHWKENHYDIVLMDIQMPEMDGFTATKEIRRIEAEDDLPRTPIIGMTAHALVGDKDKCIEAGMDAYLPKPIVEADLKREILKYLKLKKKKAA